MSLRLIFASVIIFCFSGFANAQTSAFTYQGRLTDTALPASGTYQMQFTIYDAESAGAMVGSTITNTSVSVANGVFTVSLDYSPQTPFATGADRWIELAVKKTAEGSYTTLTPRQKITSSPYSSKAASAAAADSVSATCVLCITDAQISGINGSKITGTVANATNAGTATTAGTATNALNLGGLAADTYLQTNGNGSGLTNVPGTLKWNVVAGISQQMASSNGYLAVNDAAQVTVTLPVSPNVGDTFRVAGGGKGGWKIAQNAGQWIETPINSTTSNIAGPKLWNAVDSSSDGTKLVAVEVGGRIYTSTDSGVIWIPRESNRSWNSVASSADGTKLVAVVFGGLIYTSTDSGVTWTPREVNIPSSSTNRSWTDVASSADGTKLVAVEYGGRIYTSTDSGLSWTDRTLDRFWASVASSSDGTKLVAVTLGEAGGGIYTSTNSGVNWTLVRSGNWKSIASSSDGTKLVALQEVEGGAPILTSTDSGVTWSPRENPRNWNSVASSSDGTKLVAVVDKGKIYTSTNSGLSWTPRDINRSWVSVASSSDGTKLVAVEGGEVGGRIYTSTDSGVSWRPVPEVTTLGTGGNLTGAASASVELIYVGAGRFLTIAAEGGIVVN